MYVLGSMISSTFSSIIQLACAIACCHMSVQTMNKGKNYLLLNHSEAVLPIHNPISEEQEEMPTPTYQSLYLKCC